MGEERSYESDDEENDDNDRVGHKSYEHADKNAYNDKNDNRKIHQDVDKIDRVDER